MKLTERFNMTQEQVDELSTAHKASLDRLNSMIETAIKECQENPEKAGRELARLRDDLNRQRGW